MKNRTAEPESTEWRRLAFGDGAGPGIDGAATWTKRLARVSGLPAGGFRRPQPAKCSIRPTGRKLRLSKAAPKSMAVQRSTVVRQHSAAWRAWDSRACLKQKWWGAGAAELRVCFRDGGPHVACHAWNNGAQLLRPLLLGSLCADYIGELRS